MRTLNNTTKPGHIDGTVKLDSFDVTLIKAGLAFLLGEASKENDTITHSEAAKLLAQFEAIQDALSQPF